MCPPMFTAVLVTARRWKPPRRPSPVDTQNVVRPYNEILLGLKKEILTHYSINPKDVMLHKISQHQKKTHIV